MFAPTRRNRNIGTPKQGFGQDNRFRVPNSWHDSKIFYERLLSPVMVKRLIHGKEFIFFVEPTLADYRHACTVDDVEKLICLLPPKDALNIDIIVLRQPTRKQSILNYPWGRLAFYFEADSCTGRAIVLESQLLKKPIKWSKSLSPEKMDELRRLEVDGHSVKMGKREIIIETSIESSRCTQLYRTIPHEVGHYVDYLESGEQLFDSKPFLDKEAFAHRYADEFKEKKFKLNKLPYPRIIDQKSMKRDGLNPEWFTVCSTNPV